MYGIVHILISHNLNVILPTNFVNFLWGLNKSSLGFENPELTIYTYIYIYLGNSLTTAPELQSLSCVPRTMAL